MFCTTAFGTIGNADAVDGRLFILFRTESAISDDSGSRPGLEPGELREVTQHNVTRSALSAKRIRDTCG
jgi:hypothetical protein